VPIIAVTTDGEEANEFRDGVDDFVRKPFDPVQLFDAISRVTGFTPSAPALAEIVAGLAALRAPAPSGAPVLLD
jgi:CheY-like chemotaxis protein